MMVQGLDAAEDLETYPITMDPSDKGSRSVIKKKNIFRTSLSEKIKYRQNLNVYRLKKSKNTYRQGHSTNVVREQTQSCSNTQENEDIQEEMQQNEEYLEEEDMNKEKEKGEEEVNLEKENVVDNINYETDVQLDQNDMEIGYNISKTNAVSQYMYTSNSTTNTTSNITNINNDILNAVNSQSSGGSQQTTGARLVKKDITKLGKLELLSNIENYVQLNFSNYRQFYERVGPIRLNTPLSEGLQSNHVEISLWNDPSTQLISQNSSKRKVYNIYWIPKILSNIALRAAIKFVEDCNIRDGRSIKREIECHLYMYQRFQSISKTNSTPSLILQDDWPTVEVLGYYLDKKDPGQSILISRKLTGPDFFYIIRSENNSNFVKKITPIYEFNKLDWCITALNRISQFGSVGIRHNDIKPDNIVLDVYFDQGVKKVDVKIIDLGAASMEYTKEFTGGTPWYESPEQKLLEYYTKKNRNTEMADKVNIDVSSDAWGAGLSIVEVLMGKRVVDYIKQPYGIGLLNFTGIPTNANQDHSEDVNLGGAQNSKPNIDFQQGLWWNKVEYWEINPELWVQEAKKVLGLTCDHCSKPNESNDQDMLDNISDLNSQENPYMAQEDPSNFVEKEDFEEFYVCSVCKQRFNDNVKENICKIVSRYVFNSLVVVDPVKRKSVQEVANRLRSFVTQAISYYL